MPIKKVKQHMSHMALVKIYLLKKKNTCGYRNLLVYWGSIVDPHKFWNWVLIVVSYICEKLIMYIFSLSVA